MKFGGKKRKYIYKSLVYKTVKNIRKFVSYVLSGINLKSI